MSRGRPPRRVRFQPAINMVDVVINRATTLTAGEMGRLMVPIRSALKALREGVATETQWCVLASSVEVALAIEDQGVVRGLREHLKSAEQALFGIRERALASGTWRQTALYYRELDDVVEAIRLHQFQLEQLSTREVSRAVEVAKTRVYQAGGRVIDVRLLEAAAA